MTTNTKIPGATQLLDPAKILADELELSAGDQVADLGCGAAGYFTLQAAKLVGTQGHIWAVDVLKSVLASVASRAKIEGLGNITTVWSNLEVYGATKLHDGALDAAIVNNVLHQNSDPEKILKEAFRLLKTGGKLLVVEWKTGRFPLGPAAQEKVPLDLVKTLGRSLGLKELKQFDPSPYHYGLIFVK